MNCFAPAQKIADAVLYEGYLLYPYRPSSLKNQFRWQFGVVVPPGYPDEASLVQSEFPARCSSTSRLHVRVRFLQVIAREEDDWEEGREKELDVSVGWDELPAWRGLDFGELQGRLEIYADGAGILGLRVRNLTEGRYRTRAEAIRRSFVSLHMLAAVEDGEFFSLAEAPPESSACQNVQLWPVWMGPHLVLASPIVLEDRPEVAPESPGDFFDATEIDEMLALRIRTMTPEEKREACATDPRARAIVERSDQLTRQEMSLLHGAIRPGDRVFLKPSRRADAWDMFLAGRTGRVDAVKVDMEGETYLAVSVEDDLNRHSYFYTEEVERL